MKEATELCKKLYEELSPVGVFPALTGGCLYKSGDRKDIDIVLYGHRNRQGKLEAGSLAEHLENCGLVIKGKFGFVTKTTWGAVDVDILIPESKYGIYEGGSLGKV